MLKKQFYGVEIEMTGITRKQAAEALAAYFGTRANYAGGNYETWEVKDTQGKTWSFVYDGSIKKEIKIGRKTYQATTSREYAVELVTPKLEYGELEKLQEAVRRVRKAGAKVNESCGIHIHIDAANHTANTLKNLLSIMYCKEDILFKALQVNDSREREFCRKVRENILMRIRTEKTLTMEKLASIWYGETGNQRHHYDGTRYHALNLHSVFYRGTAEFRLFNGTLHAGKIKAYINLALAISAQAISQKSAQIKKTASTNERFTFRTWLLRLGFIGKEFENTRMHLLEALEGDSAWRYEPEHYRHNNITGTAN